MSQWTTSEGGLISNLIDRVTQLRAIAGLIDLGFNARGSSLHDAGGCSCHVTLGDSAANLPQATAPQLPDHDMLKSQPLESV